MGNSKEEISLESAISIFKDLFKDKGYPKDYFVEKVVFPFSYKSLSFEVVIPLVIRDSSQTILIVDYKPQKNLTISERGIIALARVLFNPPPYFALITNLRDFILINSYTGEKKKGNQKIIPDFETLKNFTPKFTKTLNPQIEKKILAIYLSGG